MDAFNIPYYIEKNNVIYGKEDWLFFTGDNSLYYYSAINLPTQKELKEISCKVQKVGNYFKSQGKEFLLFIAPNKEEIYPEYMPDAIKINSEIKRLDMIADYIQKNTDVKIVYPKNELINAKSKGQIYYKYDTHWNSLGGFIGASTIFDKLGIEYDKNIEFAVMDRWGGDMLTMIAETAKKDVDYSVDFRSDITYSISGNDVISSNKNNKNLVYFGDSFRTAMMQYLGKEYERSQFNHFFDYYSGNEFKEKIETADTIIFECVGRYESQVFGNGGLLDRFIIFNNL